MQFVCTLGVASASQGRRNVAVTTTILHFCQAMLRRMASKSCYLPGSSAAAERVALLRDMCEYSKMPTMQYPVPSDFPSAVGFPVRRVAKTTWL